MFYFDVSRYKWDTLQSEFMCCGGYGHHQVRNNRSCTHVLYYTVCRQRRDKEQMVSDYSNVTDNLTAISRSVVNR